MASPIKATHFSWPVRVYYEDTDAGGIVYYANYFKFAERARTEWLRQNGLENSTLKDTSDMLFVVRSCAADYFKPARLDDDLTISVEVLKIGAASIDLIQRVFKNDVLLVDIKVKLATINGAGEIVKLPLDIKEKLR